MFKQNHITKLSVMLFLDSLVVLSALMNHSSGITPSCITQLRKFSRNVEACISAPCWTSSHMVWISTSTDLSGPKDQAPLRDICSLALCKECRPRQPHFSVQLRSILIHLISEHHSLGVPRLSACFFNSRNYQSLCTLEIQVLAQACQIYLHHTTLRARRTVNQPGSRDDWPSGCCHGYQHNIAVIASLPRRAKGGSHSTSAGSCQAPGGSIKRRVHSARFVELFDSEVAAMPVTRINAALHTGMPSPKTPIATPSYPGNYGILAAAWPSTRSPTLSEPRE